MARIHEQMIAAMRDIPGIPKDRRNQAQSYQFRGIDDVYLAVSPVLAQHGIYMSAEILSDVREERQSKSGGVLSSCVLRVRYSFTADDGSSVHTEAIGEGMDSGDKAAAKAMSIAQKYSILQAFLIPTSDPKDPENDSPEPAPREKPAPAKREKKPRDDAAAKLAERYKFALGCHPKIDPKAAKGIFEDVKTWNGGRNDGDTLRIWELLLDAWDAGRIASSSAVEAALKRAPPGEVAMLEKMLIESGENPMRTRTVDRR